jgi:hypothetical protein
MSKPHPIPVLCDRCRATGLPGAEPFTDFGDLLDFAPVPRRPRVGGWNPQVQRAFIAALALTGSPRQAAAAVCRAAFGVEQLRKASGSEGFNQAYDRALALAEEKGRHRLAANFAALATIEAAAHPGEHHAPTEAAPLAPVTEEDRERLRAATFRRAMEGEEVPVFHGGKRVGARRVFNDRLALYHLGALGRGSRAGGSDDSSDGSDDGAAGKVVLRGRELRIHRMLLENPTFTRAFCIKRVQNPGGIVNHHPMPSYFGHTRDVLFEIERWQVAMRASLDADPERAAAFETLIGPEGGRAEDLIDGLRHAAIILEIFYPGLPELIRKLEDIEMNRKAEERREQQALTHREHGRDKGAEGE